MACLTKGEMKLILAYIGESMLKWEDRKISFTVEDLQLIFQLHKKYTTKDNYLHCKLWFE